MAFWKKVLDLDSFYCFSKDRKVMVLSNIGTVYYKTQKYQESTHILKVALNIKGTSNIPKSKIFVILAYNMEALQAYYSCKLFYLCALKYTIKGFGLLHEETIKIIERLSINEFRLSNFSTSLSYSIKAYNLFNTLAIEKQHFLFHVDRCLQSIRGVELALENQPYLNQREQSTSKCFRNFHLLRKQQKTEVENLLFKEFRLLKYKKRQASKKWNSLKDSNKLVLLKKRKATGNKSEPFLEIDFQRYMAKLEQKQHQSKNWKHRWDSLGYEE